MKKLIFILTFTFFANFNAFANDCNDLEVNPEIIVTSSFGKLIYDNTKNIDEITQMANEYHSIESDIFAEGLALANINFDISIKTTSYPLSLQEFCVVPTQIDVFLGLNNPVIYLSNALKKDSCKYNIVLRHEKTHQQINKTAIEYYLPIFKAAVTNISKSAKPIKIANINQIKQATKQLTETYSNKIIPLVDFIKKEIAQEQLKLDNEANYKYEHKLCQEN